MYQKESNDEEINRKERNGSRLKEKKSKTEKKKTGTAVKKKIF